MPAEPRRRKQVMSIYLREDLVEALERVAAEFDVPVSRVVEILLSFQLEMGGLLENATFLLELHRRFHRTR